ncbi:hypothetical protein OIO90_003088 [Microbotryomycetes sp. JL221]|nr:hypothetical protein OIO90_003088 [Microbotryomycetes sp. JL221]
MSSEDELDPAFAHLDQREDVVTLDDDPLFGDNDGLGSDDGMQRHRLTLDDELELHYDDDDTGDVQLLGDGFGRVLDESLEVQSSGDEHSRVHALELEDTFSNSRRSLLVDALVQNIAEDEQGGEVRAHWRRRQLDRDPHEAVVADEHDTIRWNQSERHSGALPGQWLVGSNAGTGSSTPRRPRSSLQDMSSSATSVSGYEGQSEDFDEDAAPLVSDAVPLAQLDESILVTTRFVERLRQHTTIDFDGSQAVPRLPSVSVNSATIADEATMSFIDRQPLLEKLASNVVRTMLDLSRQREAQTNELMQLERAFMSRSDAAWQAALAELDEMPSPEPDYIVTSKAADSVSVQVDLPRPRAPTLLPSAFAQQFSHASVESRSTDPMFDELDNLREVTASFIASLQAINDVAQVNVVAASDVGRKVKALRNQVVTLSDDLAAVETSRSFVTRDLEAREQMLAINTGVTKLRNGDKARDLMRDIERRLDDGWTKALTLFRVEA